jgi:hypothetical protein
MSHHDDAKYPGLFTGRGIINRRTPCSFDVAFHQELCAGKQTICSRWVLPIDEGAVLPIALSVGCYVCVTGRYVNMVDGMICCVVFEYTVDEEISRFFPSL